MVRDPINYNRYTTEELLKMSHQKAIEGLTEKQQRFCEAYITSYNVKAALLKAGYSMESTSSGMGYSLRHKAECQRYIQWLKARVLDEAFIKGQDIISQWMKIAFSDITDFVDIHRTYITLKPADQVDGQLIKSIKTGRDGVSIELHDKLKALDSIAKYVEDMPKDYRQMIEERRMKLMEDEFELKRKLSDITKQEEETDGFLEALAKSGEAVWEDDELPE